MPSKVTRREDVIDFKKCWGCILFSEFGPFGEHFEIGFHFFAIGFGDLVASSSDVPFRRFSPQLSPFFSFSGNLFDHEILFGPSQGRIGW